MSGPAPSAMYGIIADITRASGYGANLKVPTLLAGLRDGSFRVDMAECDGQGRPLTVAMLDDLATSPVFHDNSANGNDQLDELVAMLLSRPEAMPWIDGVSPARLLSGLVRLNLVRSLEAVLARPDAWSASRIDADFREASARGSWLDSGLSCLVPREKVMSLYHVAAIHDSDPRIIAILANHRLDPNLPLPSADRNQYPLALASSAPMVGALVKAGATPWMASSDNTPLSVAWSRNGMASSTQADLGRILRQASQQHHLDDPREAFALARTLAGPRTVQAALTKYDLDMLAGGESGLCLADHVFLGLIEAPTRTASERTRQQAMFQWTTGKLGVQATGATRLRQALAGLRQHQGCPSPEQQQRLIEQLDHDAAAGFLHDPSQTAGLLLNAVCPKVMAPGEGFAGSTLAIAMLDRMARAADVEGPWAVPYEKKNHPVAPAEHLYGLLSEWGKLGAGPGVKGHLSTIFEQIAQDPASHTPQAIHALLPWAGTIMMYHQFKVETDKQGMLVDHPVHRALSEIFSSCVSVDASLPGFEWRAKAALHRTSTNKSVDLSTLASRLEQARLEVATPEAPKPSRRPMRM